MDRDFLLILPLLFPVFFILLWLGITSLLGALSGWYALMKVFPDREDETLLQLKGRTGFMGANVNMRGILKIAACRHGLRVGISKILGGLYAKDFFVPWRDVVVERKSALFLKTAKLIFGHPQAGVLTIYASDADKLAEAAGSLWPEQSAVETTKS